MIKQGIDLSRWNIVTSFDDIKKEGIDFVILRIGGSNGGFYKDPKFELYYKAAKKAGLKVGCYYDTGSDFITSPNGYIAAKHMIGLMKDHQFEFQVYADIESTSTAYKFETTKAAITFCMTLEKAGYFAGIYASDISGFKDRLALTQLQGRFTLWVARYEHKPTYVKDYAIWQKSSKGQLKGMVSRVDLNECSVNFPSIIKKKHLNGFGGSSNASN